MIRSEGAQHRTLLIGGQQRAVECIALALLLHQWQITVLDDGMLHRALNLGGHSVFAVEALKRWSVRRAMAYQSIKGIVAKVAEQGFAWRWHG
ncbi:IstB_IS21 domain-containing protein [Pseudomonas jessenii]